MIRKSAAYEQAVQYRKRGFTYSEIAKICDVSKSTVSNWLAGEDFSKKVAADNASKAARENKKRMQLINTSRKAERKRLYGEAEKAAALEYRHFKNSPLFMSGLMLYVAGGDVKDVSKIRLANSQFAIHAIFINFLVEFMGVEKKQLKFWLLLNPAHDEERCMKRWRKEIGLSYSQFYKNQVLGEKAKKETLQFGVGNTIIVNAVLKRKLNTWIALATKELR